MSPFLDIVGFELRYYLKRISTWVYFGVFFGIAFLLSAALSGYWKEVAVGVGGAGGVVHANSPYVAALLTGALGIFGILVVSAVMGHTAYRDFQDGIHPLFFTTPVSKGAFLGGRFLGAFLANVVILSSIPLGLYVATLMPFTDAERLGAFNAWYYFHPYLVVVVPNILFTGAIYFALGSFTRKPLPNYLAGVGLLIGYLAAGRLLSDIENKTTAALIDPFGNYAVEVVTEYWTASEKNAKLLPILTMIGVNKILWISVALVIFGLCYWRFRFTHVQSEKSGRQADSGGEVLAPGATLQLPSVTTSFSAGARWTQFRASFKQAAMGIVLNVYFLAIVLAGVLFMLLTSGQVGKLYGTPTWPVTYGVLEVLGGTFGLFIIIIVTFFAGELIWRERDLKVNQIVDSLPTRDWIGLAAKFCALTVVIFVLQAAVLLTGMLVQAAKGYTHFEVGIYLRVLFGLNLSSFLLYVVLAMLVHALVNQKYVGHLVVILVYFGIGFLSSFGFNHLLYRYGRSPEWIYSDMNGFGTFIAPVSIYKLYWLAVAVLFLVATMLFWVRGQETWWRQRMSLASQRNSGPMKSLAIVALVGAVGLGAFIFYNTNVLNTYRTSYEQEELQAKYERDYKKYENLPQPRITGVVVGVDLYPREGRVDFSGTYAMVNKTEAVIPKLHVLVNSDADKAELEFTPPAKLDEKETSEELGYRVYELSEPLLPGGTLQCRFDVRYGRHGFTNGGPDTRVIENGSFVNSGLLPGFGYSDRYELSQDDTRRKHDLEKKERMAAITDMVARQNTYISNDSDWIDFEATVSTDPDQIALAPGYLEREWTEGGRRHFHYKMDSKILGFYAFVSARWKVVKDEWQGMPVEIYHHPGHEYNIQRMVDGVKASLDYYTREFGPYQHRQVRILEFPRLYGTFAQSFPNTIPFSESIGFIARLDKDDNIDYPFYVTAHEVAHQWFAHQVIGGNVQGCTMLSESLSQYAALMVMEKAYGREHMRRFLKYELDNYLQGRSFENKKELPLALNENQQYIHYNKGSVVFYALREYLGEEVLNAVIRDYIAKVKFQEPPYTIATELVDAIREAAPLELKAFVDDQLLKITLYDFRAKEARATKRADGKWDVAFEYEAKQLQADEKGNEVEVPLDLDVAFGVFDEGLLPKEDDDVPLVLEKRRITAGKGTMTFVVDKQPVRAGIDPWHLLVDRQSDDNLVRVKVVDHPAS